MEENVKVNPDISILTSEKENIRVGRYTYGNPKFLTWSDEERITIGSFCSISGEVVIFGGGEHRADWITTSPIRIMFDLEGARQDGIPCTKGETRIGNDVWIGYGALVLSGVTVGDGAVIGARAVVTKDVEPYSIVAGNPARVIKKRFDAHIIEDFLKIKWWEWPVKKIIDNVDLLCGNDPQAADEFIRRHRVY